MVLSFLRAEISSSRFDDFVVNRLTALGLDRRIVDGPNLLDANENRSRKKLLDSYRGYERRVLLFQGFPTDATWRRVALEEMAL